MRAFDILPPKKVKRLTKQEKKRQKRTGLYFVFFLIFVAVFFIIFYGSGKFPMITPASSPSITTPTPSPSINPSNKTQNQLTIKLLNGTGRVEESQKVQKILTDAGFTITTTESALNLYDSTIVYFQAPFENYANQIANLLSPYKAKSQKFSQETQYDIVVVIGTK